MFKILIEEEDINEDEIFYNIELEFENDAIKFTFRPESTEINGVDIESDSCTIYGDCSDGDCYLSWDHQSIIFCCSRYGSGLGGELKLTIKNTPEVMNSLKSCLNKWKSKKEETNCNRKLMF